MSLCPIQARMSPALLTARAFHLLPAVDAKPRQMVSHRALAPAGLWQRPGAASCEGCQNQCFGAAWVSVGFWRAQEPRCYGMYLCLKTCGNICIQSHASKTRDCLKRKRRVWPNDEPQAGRAFPTFASALRVEVNRTVDVVHLAHAHIQDAESRSSRSRCVHFKRQN